MRGVFSSALVAMVVVPTIVQAAVVQFSEPSPGADSYSSNFVQVFLNGMATPTAQQNNTNQNLVHTAGAGASNFIARYDTPSGGAATTFTARSFTVSTDVKLGAVGNSLGFYIGTAVADSTANDVLALFNVNNAGTADTLRFAPGSNFTSNGVGTLEVSASADTGLAPNSVITLTLTVTEGVFSLSATDGINTLTSTSAYTGFTLPANYEIGFRSGAAASSSNVFDNFSVTVPEPTSLVGLGIAAAALIGRRRRACVPVIASTAQHKGGEL